MLAFLMEGGLKHRTEDFPGGPVFRTPRFHTRGPGSIPSQETKIPQPSGVAKKIRNKINDRTGKEWDLKGPAATPSPAAWPGSCMHPGGSSQAAAFPSGPPSTRPLSTRRVVRGTPGTALSPSPRRLAASGWLLLKGGLRDPCSPSAQSTIPDPLPAHPPRITSLHVLSRDWSEQPRNHEGGPTSTPTCPEGAVTWVQLQTQEGSGSWDRSCRPTRRSPLHSSLYRFI